MDKKSQIKLPQIKKSHKQSLVPLSKTTSDKAYTPKLRPASSSKVEDLEKKLFNKLDAYQKVSVKRLSKKVAKIGKEPSTEYNTVSEGQEGYERLQKLMPGLYSKLIETKKGNYMSENLISEFETPQSLPLRRESSQEIAASPLSVQREVFITEKEEQMISQEEMEKIFKEYALLQGIAPTTTSKDMKELNLSISTCEHDIKGLKMSMEGLIHQIGEYIEQIEKDNEYFQM